MPIGVDERALEPVLLDLFERDQNLLVMGDGECGKTDLLRLVAERLVERYSSDEAVFAVMDPRRTLRGVVPGEYMGGYASGPRVCAGLVGGVVKEVEGRLSGDGDVDSLEPGSFKGPRIAVLADDYDVLTTAGQKPLVPFVPNGRDIGLRFVVARRVAGAGRGMYDPLVQAMRGICTSALVMSGDRGEGQLLPRVYAANRPAGRGRWITRGGSPRLIQTALREPREAGE
ncbi:hypothetical protein A6A08_02960 [Nocardiopsis sp. TSRI0078]|nr:hypothetical protein A6A08_02960 [Nocardiopsis sp. TSRI0078]